MEDLETEGCWLSVYLAPILNPRLGNKMKMALLRNIKDKQKNVFHKLIDKEFRLGNDIKMILK